MAAPPSSAPARRLRMEWLTLLAVPWLASVANASPYGTTLSGTISNLPSSDSATISFDGLPEAAGSSGLVVEERSTSLGSVELVEFTLRTQDGAPFVGQQDDALLPANVSFDGLHWLGDPVAASVKEGSAFVFPSIDGVPQPMSDVLGRGLVFGVHPRDPTIQVLLLPNPEDTGFSITFGVPLEGDFAALVAPVLADQIDALHVGFTAGPAPEPSSAAMLVIGGMLLATLARRRMS